MSTSQHRHGPGLRGEGSEVRGLLTAAVDQSEVCRLALDHLRERFGALVVSVGFAASASDQLCVLTDAGVDGDAIPSFAHFPMRTRMLLTDVLGSSDVRVIDADDYVAAYPTAAALVRRPGVQSLIAVGFSRQGVIGAVSLGLPDRPAARAAADLQAVVATIGDALAACVRRTQHQALVGSFQRRFMPAEQSASDRLLRRSLYVPAAPDGSVGADWYDVFDLDDGRVAAIVGDIAGRGPDAVVAMTKAATALRTLLIVDPAPHRAIEQLDRVASTTRSIAGATCVVAVVDEDTGSVELCRAGHPPALVGGASGWEVVDAGGGPPVGFPAGERTSAGVTLGEGATLLLHSDGLQCLEPASDAGGGDVPAALARIAASTPSLLVAELVERCLGDRVPHDDVVVVALQRGASPGVWSRTVSAEAGQVGSLRRELGQWLRASGATADAPAVELAVSELTSNVVEHAYRSSAGPTDDGTVIVDVELLLDRVRVTVIDDGRWSDQIVDTVRGRGLAVVEHLAAATALRSSAQGTVARVEILRTDAPAA